MKIKVKNNLIDDYDISHISGFIPISHPVFYWRQIGWHFYITFESEKETLKIYDYIPEYENNPQDGRLWKDYVNDSKIRLKEIRDFILSQLSEDFKNQTPSTD